MSNQKRICILTPTHLGSTPRVVKEATALEGAGFDVRVIALRTLDHVESRDQSVLRAARWQCERIDLRSRWQRLPARTGYAMTRRMPSTWRRARHAEMALSPFSEALRRAAMRTPADLYIAHYPPALPAAAAAAGRHRSCFSFDAEDFHPGDWPDGPEHNAERTLLSEIEGRYLPHCRHLTAASPGIADAYAERYGIRRPVVVLNTFPRAESPATPAARGTAEPRPSIYWFSQVIGPDRGLECAVRSISLSRARPHLYLRGTLATGYAEALNTVAAAANVTDRVHILAPDTPDKMTSLSASYDLGLVAETGHSRNRAIALTNKLFTYLLAGTPPLMSDIPAHRQFAAETGMTGLLYPPDDAPALARCIDTLFADSERLRDARQRAYELGQSRYNWDVDRVTLLDTVRRSLGLPAAARCCEDAGRE